MGQRSEVLAQGARRGTLEWQRWLFTPHGCPGSNARRTADIEEVSRGTVDGCVIVPPAGCRRAKDDLA